MRIGIDARLAQWPGIGRYLREMVRWLPRVGPEHDYLVFCDHTGSELLSTAPKVAFISETPRIFTVSEQLIWPRLLRRHALDVFFSPHLVVPLFSGVPTTLAVHDLIPLVYAQSVQLRRARLYFWAMIHAGTRRARSLVAVSSFTMAEIHRVLGIAGERITVIPEGSSFNGATSGHELPPQLQVHDPFILYIGTRKPWKNLTTLLKAFAIHLREFPRTKLLVAGQRAAHDEVDAESIAQALGISESVVWLGRVTDEQLHALYKASTVLVCPSLYEGFGLTAMEGMSLGCAVVASHIPPHREVLGDCALFCDPLDANDMAGQTARFFRDPELRGDFGKCGIERGRTFSWERAAQSLLKVLASRSSKSSK